MLEQIDFFAAVVAALTTFVVGGLWYSPLLFLKRWLREMNLGDSQQGHPVKIYGMAFLFSLVAALFLSHMLGAEDNWRTGMVSGALLGLCFVATAFGINYMFANRSLAAVAIDGGYFVVQFAAFGLVLGAWP